MKVNVEKLKRLEEKASQANSVLRDVNERHREARSRLQTFYKTVESSVLRTNNGHKAWAEIEKNWPDVNLENVRPLFAPEYSEKVPDKQRWERSIVFSEMREIDKMKAEEARLRQEAEIASTHRAGRSACLPRLREFAEQAGKTGGL